MRPIVGAASTGEVEAASWSCGSARRAAGSGRAQVGLDLGQPRDGRGVGVAARDASEGRTGVTSTISWRDGVEDRHDRRPDHDRVGQVQRVGIGAGRAARPAGPCRSRARRTGPRPSAAGPSGRSIREAATRARRESSAPPGSGVKRVGGDGVALGDLGLVAAAAPDQVRLQRDDRIAAAPGAALDRLEAGRRRAGRGRSSERPRPASPGRRSAASRRPGPRRAA